MHLVTIDPDNRLQMRALAFKIRQGHFKTGCCILKAQVHFIKRNVKDKCVITLRWWFWNCTWWPLTLIMTFYEVKRINTNDIPIEIKSLISIRQVTTNSINVSPYHSYIYIKSRILYTLSDLLTPFWPCVGSVCFVKWTHLFQECWLSSINQFAFFVKWT